MPTWIINVNLYQQSARSFRLNWLISHGWKYRWLVWCERKTLFKPWIISHIRANKPKRTGWLQVSVVLYSVVNTRFQDWNLVLQTWQIQYIWEEMQGFKKRFIYTDQLWLHSHDKGKKDPWLNMSTWQDLLVTNRLCTYTSYKITSKTHVSKIEKSSILL